jgi:hypothetical protein
LYNKLNQLDIKMETAVIIQEIVKLPVKERFIIIEDTLKSIKEETTQEKTLAEGAKALLADYQEDDELTALKI